MGSVLGESKQLGDMALEYCRLIDDFTENYFNYIKKTGLIDLDDLDETSDEKIMLAKGLVIMKGCGELLMAWADKLDRIEHKLDKLAG